MALSDKEKQKIKDDLKSTTSATINHKWATNWSGGVYPQYGSIDLYKYNTSATFYLLDSDDSMSNYVAFYAIGEQLPSGAVATDALFILSKVALFENLNDSHFSVEYKGTQSRLMATRSNYDTSEWQDNMSFINTYTMSNITEHTPSSGYEFGIAGEGQGLRLGTSKSAKINMKTNLNDNLTFICSENYPTYTHAYDINGTSIYEGIRDANFSASVFVDDTPTHDYSINGMLVVKNYAQAIEYLTNGTIPNDARYTTADGSQTYDGTVDDNDKEQTNQSDKRHIKDDIIPTDLTTPSHTGTLRGNNFYMLKESELSTFIDWFNNDMIDWTDPLGVFANMFTGVYGSISNCVKSIRIYPFEVQYALLDNEIDTTEYDNIVVGRLYTPDTYNIIKSTLVKIHLARLNLEQTFNNFKDYPPDTKISFYVPYCGIVDFDVAVLYGHELNIELLVDFNTGNATGVLTIDGALLKYVNGKCGYDIPITLQNSGEYAQRMFSQASSVASNPTSVINSISGGNAPSFETVSSADDLTSMMLPQQCHYILQVPTFDVQNRIPNYGKLVGWRTERTQYIQKGDGFIQTDTPYLPHFSGKKSHLEKIYSLMKEGVYA